MLIDTKLYQQSWGPKRYWTMPGMARSWSGLPIPRRVRFLNGWDWSSAGLDTIMSRRIVKPLANAKDLIRSGVPISREISLWATIGAVIR